MTVKLLESGIIPAFGYPNTRWGFWEDVRLGRYKVYIEYVYYSTHTSGHAAEVWVEVWTRDAYTETFYVGDVETKASFSLAAVRAYISERARARIEEIKAALLRHVLERVQEHNR